MYIIVTCSTAGLLILSLANNNTLLLLVRFHLQFDLHLRIHLHLGLDFDSIIMHTHAKSYRIARTFVDGPSTNVSRFNFRGLTVLPTVLQYWLTFSRV